MPPPTVEKEDTVPLRSDWSEAACPIARSLDVVGDPWVLLVLREALPGPPGSSSSAPRSGSPTTC